MSPRRPAVLLAALVPSLLSLAAGCASPEATRIQGGGAGADPGNRGQVVQMHEGSKPYHETPRLIEPYGSPELEPARQAHQLSLRERDKRP